MLSSNLVSGGNRTRPGANQVIKHKILAVLVVFIGVLLAILR